MREDEVASIYGGEPVCRCGRLRGEDERRRQRVGGRREAGGEGSRRGGGPAGGRGAPLGPERGTSGRVAALGWRRGQQLGGLALGQPPERERWPGAGGERGTPHGGYEHRTVPAGWRHRAPFMAQVAEREGAAAGGEGVKVGGAFVHLEERDGEGRAGAAAAAACFGQVSRRLGRLLKRLPKSRSWSDSLRMLRRSSSNGSLLNNSGRRGGQGLVSVPEQTCSSRFGLFILHCEDEGSF